MWKKEEAQKRATAPETSGNRERPTPRPASGERATIGRSITIRGDVTGDEDLVIQGRVEGSVDLKQHAVTVGPEGEVKADISGRVVTVEGHVVGNLRADEQVVLRGSARVEGDISAARVTLEDGAYFSGGVEMTEASGPSRTGGGGSGAGGGSRSGGGSSTGGSSSSSSAGSSAGSSSGKGENGSDADRGATTGKGAGSAQGAE